MSTFKEDSYAACNKCLKAVFGIDMNAMSAKEIFDNPCLLKEAATQDLGLLMAEFDKKGYSHDKMFGDVQILQHKETKEMVILKVLQHKNEKLLTEAEESFRKRQELICPHLIQLRYMLSRRIDSFCGKVFKSYLLFDFVLMDLESEVIERNDLKQPLHDTEIWKICDSLLTGLQYLYKQQIPHSSLTMKTIWVDQYGLYKISDPALFSLKKNYEVVFMGGEKDCDGIYLSPELMKVQQLLKRQEMDRKSDNPKINEQKSDIFTLGVLILEIATLSDMNQCYDYYHCRILLDLLDKKLNTIKSSFGEQFHEFLSQFLIVDPLQRPDLNKLMELLARYTKGQTAHQTNQTIINTKTQYNQTNNESGQEWQKSILDSVAQKPGENMQYSLTPNVMQTQYVGDWQGKATVGQSGQFQPSSASLSIAPIGMTSNQQSMRARPKPEIVNEKYQNGCSYEGEKKNGARNGFGKYWYEGGGYYEGNWHDDEMSGQGTLYNAKGEVVYDGHWKGDKLEGFGILTNQQVTPLHGDFDYKNFNVLEGGWLRYEGDFSNDKKHGYGILILSNQNTFKGHFRNDEVHGTGTFTTKTSSIQGVWDSGVFSHKK